MPHKDPEARRAYERARRAKYPERQAELQREQRERDPEKWLAKHRSSRARVMHGKGIDRDWPMMWELQNGCCYLCGSELGENTKAIHVDHDHRCCPQQKSCETCRRGLVCRSCNWAVGFAGDDPDKLRRMADNLEAAKRAFEQRMQDTPVHPELLGS